MKIYVYIDVQIYILFIKPYTFMYMYFKYMEEQIIGPWPAEWEKSKYLSLLVKQEVDV